MEEKNKKLKITANKKVVTFSLVALLLLIIVSTSYAYFTAVIEGNDTAKQTSVTSGTMSVKLINTEEINLNGMMPGDSKEVHFSVQNTGSATATYGVGLLVSENNFGDKNDLVYTITSDNSGGSKAQSVLPSKSTTPSTLIPVVLIPTGKTQNYTMTITFLETNDDQNDNQGKTFSGKIQLVDSSNSLASNLKENANKKVYYNFNEVEPQPHDGYWRLDHQNVLYKEYNETMQVSKSYTIDGNTGFYELENPIEINSYSGYEGYYFIPIDIDSIDTKDVICKITKTYDNNETSTVKEADCLELEYAGSINRIEETQYHQITKDEFKFGAPAKLKRDEVDYNNESGMYQAMDDNGLSYYFRGIVENNYVQFADKVWRVVRINGDGSVRIILNEVSTNTQAFNLLQNDHKYVGYTYDNQSACTKNDPCISSFNVSKRAFENNKNVVNSAIKNYLENWYVDNLSDYDKYIEETGFCNDTSYRLSENTRYYKSYDQTKNGEPSLKCNDTSETYGGYYRLKIGMLTADEINMAGIKSYGPYSGVDDMYYITGNNYLSNSSMLTLSPLSSSLDSISMLSMEYNELYSDSNLGVKPVINLKADVKILSGDGTKDNPYVIE